MFPPSTPRPNPPPKAGKRTWFMEWLNKSIPVVYGISFPRETPATYTFITEGSAVSPVQAYFLISEQNDTAERKVFPGLVRGRGIYGNARIFPLFRKRHDAVRPL